jgi:hypothetical protein
VESNPSSTIRGTMSELTASSLLSAKPSVVFSSLESSIGSKMKAEWMMSYSKGEAAAICIL